MPERNRQYTIIACCRLKRLNGQCHRKRSGKSQMSRVSRPTQTSRLPFHPHITREPITASKHCVVGRPIAVSSVKRAANDRRYDSIGNAIQRTADDDWLKPVKNCVNDSTKCVVCKACSRIRQLIFSEGQIRNLESFREPLAFDVLSRWNPNIKCELVAQKKKITKLLKYVIQ